MNQVKLLIIFLTLLTTSLEASSIFYSSFPFKEAKITYKIGGNIEGNQTTYIKDYGKKIATYTTLKSHIMNKKHLQKSLTIIDHNQKTTIDLITNKATTKPTLRSSLLKLFRHLKVEDQEYLLSTPSDEVADIECQTLVIDDKKVCVNGSLTLLSEFKIFGYKEQIEAIKVEEIDIDDSFFTLPKDIKIVKKSEDLLKAKEIIESMLE